MSNSPRHFPRRTVLTGLGASLAGVLGGAPFPEVLQAGPTQVHPDLRRDRFVPLLDSSFELRADGKTIPVRLVEVADNRHFGDTRHRYVSYNVVFEAPPGAPVESRSYALHHPSLGSFELFLSPVEAGRKRLALQACFSSLA